MAEVRTTSATGGEKGVKEQRHDLLPRPALDRISEVYAFGAGKYADHNWRKGYEWSKSYAAAQRHLTAFWDGEDADDESGLSHLAHAGFHIFALLTWITQDGAGVDNPMDDRWTTAFERARLANEADEVLLARLAERRRLSALALDGLEPEEPLHGQIQRDSVLVGPEVEQRLRFDFPQVSIADFVERSAFGPDLLRKRSPIDYVNDSHNR